MHVYTNINTFMRKFCIHARVVSGLYCVGKTGFEAGEYVNIYKYLLVSICIFIAYACVYIYIYIYVMPVAYFVSEGQVSKLVFMHIYISIYMHVVYMYSVCMYIHIRINVSFAYV